MKHKKTHRDNLKSMLFFTLQFLSRFSLKFFLTVNLKRGSRSALTSMKVILSLFLSLLLFSCYSKKPAIETGQLNKASKQMICRRQEKSALDYEQRAEEQELSAKHNRQKAALLNISDKSSNNDKRRALDYEQEAEKQELSAKHNRQRAKALQQR